MGNLKRNKAGAPRKVTKEKVLKLIPTSFGIIKRMSDALGCDRQHLSTWLKKPENKELNDKFKLERNTVLDIMENNVMEAGINGDLDVSKWYLARIGRPLGYGDRQDIKIEAQHKVELVGSAAQDVIAKLRKKKS